MTKQSQIMLDLNQKWTAMAEELALLHTFEEYDDIFFLSDYFLGQGFVSDKISRSVCRRITDTYNSWVGYLHGLIFPNNGFIITAIESESFSDQEKEDIMHLISKIMDLTATNGIIGISKDKQREAKFMDDSVDFWNSEFKPRINQVLQKVKAKWTERAGTR